MDNRQPALFNFKSTETLRRSGLTPKEERELIGFCLSDNYPREHVIARTGTCYKLKSEYDARRLLANLHYGTKELRTAITTSNQLRFK